MESLPARLLVDLPNWLGDFIHALPALARLAGGNRGGETWAVVPAPHEPLARLVGVQTIARPPKAGFLWACRHLRGRFDVALTLRHSTRAKLVLAGAGAHLPLASRGRGASALGLSTFTVARELHQRHDLDPALGRLGMSAVADEPFVLRLPECLRRRGQRQRALLVDGAPLVALLPGSRGPAKRYPRERYAAVAGRLAARGIASVVVVGPGEEDLAAALGTARGVRVVPTTWGLDETAALLGVCDAAVGNDSGLTHLTALVGCPTLALFGPTDARRTAPVGGGRILYGDAPEDRNSLAGIEPERVASTLLDLIAFHRRNEATPSKGTFDVPLGFEPVLDVFEATSSLGSW